MRSISTKTGTSDDAVPSGAPSALARSFAILGSFGTHVAMRTGTLRGYLQALDAGGVAVAGVTCTAQLYFCDPATNVWYAVGPAQTLTAESHFVFPFAPLDANTSACLRLTTFANVGTTATVVVHVVESGLLSDIHPNAPTGATQALSNVVAQGSNVAAVRRVWVTFDLGQAGIVYVGKDNTVTNTGANAIDVLYPGDRVPYEHDNANRLWFIASAGTPSIRLRGE